MNDGITGLKLTCSQRTKSAQIAQCLYIISFGQTHMSLQNQQWYHKS